MKVDYLFSNNKKVGSRLISWAAKQEVTGLDECPSHMAILLNDTWVVESTFTTGIRIIPYFKWKQKNKELHKIPCDKVNRSSSEVLEKALRLWGKGYDWLGILYFAWAYIKLIVKKESMPKSNKWQNKSKYFCTEYAGSLTDEDFSMRSPASVCAQWLKEEK